MPASRQAQYDRLSRTRGNNKGVVRGNLGTETLWVDSTLSPVHHSLVNAVLDVRGTIRHPPQPLCIALVLREEQMGFVLAMLARKPVLTQRGMGSMHKVLSLQPSWR